MCPTILAAFKLSVLAYEHRVPAYCCYVCYCLRLVSCQRVRSGKLDLALVRCDLYWRAHNEPETSSLVLDNTWKSHQEVYHRRAQLRKHAQYVLSKLVEHLLSRARTSAMSCFGMKSLTVGREAYMSNGNGLLAHFLVQDPSLSWYRLQHIYKLSSQPGPSWGCLQDSMRWRLPESN